MPSAAYTFVLNALPVEQRASLLDLGARLGLNDSAPEWAYLALGRYATESLEENLVGIVEALRAERTAFEATATEFGRLADTVPARVEQAVRDGIPAMSDAFAERVDEQVVDRIAEVVSAQATKGDAVQAAALERIATAATASSAASAESAKRAAAAGSRAAIAAGIWYPAVAVLGIALGAFATFGPVHLGPSYDAGRRAQGEADIYTARNAPKKWASYVRAYNGGH